MSAKELQRRPEIRAESVEDLVDQVLRGAVRIPSMQRPLRWETRDVVDLFDSVYRGYPIGTLVLLAAPALAGRLEVGPLEVFAEELARALWVLDGQQRLTTLAAGLARPPPLAGQPMAKDPFVVFFDPRSERFHGPPASGVVPTGWVPVSRLRDAAALGEWLIQEWVDGNDARLGAVVREASQRLREYRVPCYIVETSDEQVAMTIFDRLNARGRALDRAEVLHGIFPVLRTATWRDLADELAQLGMGTPEESQLRAGVLALGAHDPTRPFEPRDENLALLTEAAAVYRRTLGFLRVHGEIPHLRLLPHPAPLFVLARFFALHPQPGTRTRTLLVRWTWRFLLSHAGNDRTLVQRAIASIDADEEASVQRLLRLVVHHRPPSLRMPDRFEIADGDARIIGVALAAQRPLSTDQTSDMPAVDVTRTVDAHVDALREVFPGHGRDHGSPANRVLLHGEGPARQTLAACIERLGVDNAVLRSHLIDAAAAEALQAHDVARFVAVRTTLISDAVTAMGDRLAEWGQNDRPSIEYLLSEVERE